MALTLAVSLALAGCAATTPQKPIEIKGPLVDTPPRSRPRPVTIPPVPQLKPPPPPTADDDINNRLDDIETRVHRLQKQIEPPTDLVPSAWR